METKKKRPSVKEMQSACDRFNVANPVGSDVFVKLDGVDEPFRTKTKSTAQIMGGHSAVIWLENVSGCYLLDRVSKECPQCGYTEDDAVKHGLLKAVCGWHNGSTCNAILEHHGLINRDRGWSQITKRGQKFLWEHYKTSDR